MSRLLRLHHSLIRCVIFSASINFICSGLASALSNTREIPDNARANTYGDGWECVLGFRAHRQQCVKIVIPENAYPSSISYERGWKCAWGYIRTGETCTKIEIPSHAYLNSFGTEWECKRGYRKDHKSCVAVKVPEHGFYVDTEFGIGWRCERGYIAHDDTCVALSVPENAHIDYSGSAWECNPPFIERQKQCELPDSFW